MRINLDMTEGNLFKKIIIFAIPIILSGLLQLFYNAADLIICDQFGTTANSTAAISATNSLINLIVNLFLGLSVGANVLMARCIGSKNVEKGQKVVYTSMIFSLVFGVIIGLFGFFFSKYFLKWMGTPDEIIDLSTNYLKIYFIGVPFTMIYNFGASLFRAKGDSLFPFLFLAFAGLFNIAFNLIFVCVFKIDVFGVALATVIAQAISAGLIIFWLKKSNSVFHFKFSELRFYKNEALEIIKIGLPAGIQSALFSISNVLIQSSVNSLGTYVLSGNGASQSLEGFIYTSMNGCAQAAIAFVAANYGAGKLENIKKILIYTYIWIIIMNIITGLTIYLLKEPLLGLYLSSVGENLSEAKKVEVYKIALDAAVSRFTIITITYFLCGMMDTTAYSIRGMGNSTLPMVISLIGACGFRILWIYVFFPMEGLHSIFGLALSYPISWAITLTILIIAYILWYKKIKAKHIKNLEENEIEI